MQGRHSVEIIVRKAVIESDLNELDGHYLLAGDRFRYRKRDEHPIRGLILRILEIVQELPRASILAIRCVFNGLNGQRIWIDEYVAFRNFAE